MNVAIFVLLLAGVIGASFAFGGAPERWMAAMFLGAALLSRLAYSAEATRFHSVERWVAVVDLVLLAGITVLLLRADRFWPIAMFATHGVTVLAHLVKRLDLSIVRHAYAISIVAPAYLTLLILLVAVVRHRLRLRHAGRDLDWSWT